MTDTEFEDYWNQNMAHIWDQINWIDRHLEENPNPKKQKELEEIMDRLKAVMRLRKSPLSPSLEQLEAET